MKKDNCRKTFTNTTKWYKGFLKYVNNFDENCQKIYDLIPKIIPPQNCSLTTQNEIDNIKSKQKNLTSEKKEEILNQVYDNYCFDLFEINIEDRKIINELSRLYVIPIYFTLKHKYNRVRPYYLVENLNTYAPHPSHASYPSGHSTQMYFVAHYMSSKYPENKDKYFKIADDISINREYAGVHYASDTEYGKTIAKIIFENLPTINN
jgi:hypothetical protein